MTIRRLFCTAASSSLLFAVACGGSAPPPASPHEPPHAQAAPGREAPGEEAIEQWDKRHPEAARELGAWVKAHPEAAELFFEWDAHNTARAHELVTWAIRHPGDNIDVFVMEHRGWEYFDKIMEHHRPAAEAFLGWARRHGQAAEALMSHPGGLGWAGDHLYAADRRMDHPRR